MSVRLNSYYALYSWLGNSRNRYLAIRLARSLGIRHLVVRFDTNFLCNLKCQTCYFSGPTIKPMLRSAMTLEQFKKVAREVFPRTRVLFLSCGGEPLMSKSFDKFLDVTAEFKVPFVGFTTNALLFKPETVDAVMRNRVSEIIVSVDGATAPTFEYIRQGGKFDVLLEKLQMLADAKARAKSKLPALRFNFTVTRSNFREAVQLVELAKRFGVETIKFRHFTDWGGRFKFHDESLQGHETEFNEILAEARARTAEYGIKLYSPEPFADPGAPRERVASLAELLDGAPLPACTLPWYHLYISPEGLTRPCTYMPVGQHSLFDHTLAQIQAMPENAQRRQALRRDPAHSCLATICMGQVLRQANEDSNNLAQYDDRGQVEESLRLHPIDEATATAATAVRAPSAAAAHSR